MLSTKLFSISGFLWFWFLLAGILGSWVDSRFIKSSELARYSRFLGVMLSLRLIMILMLPGTLLAALWHGIQFPLLIWPCSLSWPLGYVFPAALFLIAATLILFRHFSDPDRWEKRLALGRKWVERIFLVGMNKQLREQYELHGRWRYQVLGRELQRRWQYAKLWQSVVGLRWLWVFLVGATTIACVYFLAKSTINGDSSWISQINASDFKELGAGWNALLVLLGAPVAFVIWLFRDQNNRQQIENQRKDINLKDFQQLAEWASGLHLPEDTLSEKTTDDSDKKTSRETTSPPQDTILHTTGRREGAACLQISAIYQLQAFLQGEYGTYFQRPAFHLLKSLWLVQMHRHIREWEINDWPLSASDYTNFNNWREELVSSASQPLAQCITLALSALHGRVLRNHRKDLPGIMLPGLNSQLPSLLQPLELYQLDLSGLVAPCANLYQVQLQGANLSKARLYGANLSRAQLQGTDLRQSRLQYADLSMAQLQGSTLMGSWLHHVDCRDAGLQGADMRLIELQKANLRRALLQDANLEGANLKGAKLEGANLYGARLINIKADKDTLFHCARTDDSTLVYVGKLRKLRVGNPQFPEDYDIDEAASQQLRQRLRDENGLILPDSPTT